MSVTDRIVRGFKATLGARLLNNVLNGLLMLLLARVLLSPEEYGLLYLVIAVLGVAQLAAELGLSRSGARYVSEYKETDAGKVPYIIRTTLGIQVALIVLVGGALAAGNEVIASLLDEPEVATLLLVGAALLAFQSLSSYSQTLFQGFSRVSRSAIVQVVEIVTRFVFVVALTVLGFGVVGALVGYLIGALFAAIVGVVMLYRQFYARFDDDGGERSLRNRILRYSVPLTASSSANVIDKRVDTVLIGVFLNPLAVSYYVLSKQIVEFVNVPASSLGFSVSPTYGEQKANESLEHAARIYEDTVQYVLLLYVPAAIGIILVAEPAIRLVFGDGYAGAAPVLQILSIYVVFRSISNVTTNSLDYLGRATDRAIAKGVTAVANFLLNVALIPIYGVTGAAAATVVTYGVYTAVNVYIMNVELPLRLSELGRSVGLIGAIAVGMGISVYALVPYVSGIVTLAAVIALGVTIWGSLATVAGLLEPRELIGEVTQFSS